MVRIIIYGPQCFGIKKDDALYVFNPHEDLHESQIIARDSVTAIFGDKKSVQLITQSHAIPVHSLDSSFSYEDRCHFVPLDGAWAISAGDIEIVYRHDTTVDLVYDKQPTVVLVDLSARDTNIIDSVVSLGSRYVVPLHVSSDMQAIDFCRQVMQLSKSVPKYFKPGQYLLCDL